MEGPDERRQTFRICAVLALLTLLVYAPVRQNGFVSFDDHEYILENSHVTPGLTWSGIVWAFTTGYASNWHPLTWISHMLDCQLYGVQPAGHHLTNAILHTANALLLFILLQRMTGSRWRSAFVAALFAWHPIHVESVAWASERKDTLSTLFWLLTMLAYVRYVNESRAKNPHAKAAYGWALLFFAMGLMSKPMLVTLPCVLLLVDFWPLNRGGNAREQGSLASLPWKRMLLEKIPFFIFAGTASCVTFLVQQTGGAMTSFEKLPLTVRAGNAALAYMRYLGKTVWPADLAAFYPYPQHQPILPIIVSVVLLSLLSLLFVMAAKRHPYLLTGWFWYLGTLVPTIGLVQVGAQAMADRYMYIPGIGLFLMLAWGLNDLLAAWPYRQKALAAAGSLVLIACCALCFVQVRYWRDNITLFGHANDVTTDNYVALTGLGGALGEDKRYDEALQILSSAVRIKTNYVQGLYNLGTVLLSQNRATEALGYFETALKNDPNYAQAHANLGRALLMLGKPGDAYPHLLKAVEIMPDYTLGHYNLGTFYIQQGKFSEAIDQFSQAIHVRPDYVEAHANLGVALMQSGRKPEGIEELSRAASLNPDDPTYILNLGLALAEVGRFDEAEAAFTHLAKLQPDDFHARYNLGTFYLQRSKFNEAIEELSQAIRLKPDYSPAHANRGAALIRAGRQNEAIIELTEAARLTPDDHTAHYSLAAALEQQHKSQEAAASYREAIRLKPDYLDALNNLSWLLSANPDPQIRNGTEAVQFAQKACELTGNRQPVPLLTLANAQAEAGQLTEATNAARKARELAQSAGQNDTVARADKLLESFSAGKPFREAR